MHAAYQEQWDRRVHLANPVNQANLELQAYPVILANHRVGLVNRSHHHRASHVHQDHLDHLDLLDHLEMPVNQGRQVDLEQMHHQVNLDRKDRQDKLENLDHKDHQEIPVHLLQANLLFLENLGLPENQEYQDHPDHQADQAVMVHQVQLDQRDHKVQMANREQTVHQDNRDHQDHQEARVKEESVQSIVPLMVVYFSKTVLVVKWIVRMYYSNSSSLHQTAILLIYHIVISTTTK